jgi:hypothetical protein
MIDNDSIMIDKRKRMMDNPTKMIDNLSKIVDPMRKALGLVSVLLIAGTISAATAKSVSTTLGKSVTAASGKSVSATPTKSVSTTPAKSVSANQKVAGSIGPETRIQYLSGRGSDDAVLWDFECTEGRRAGEKTKIAVPSCWELQGFGTYQYGIVFYNNAEHPGIAKEKGLYKTTFRLPADWEGRVIHLVFDGVMTDCEATLNGRRAVKLHQGGFYRFKADVSDRIYFGNKENVLEVTVSKESANKSVNMAERRADFWNFGGIFRPVFIEALPATNMDRITLDAQADGNFKAEIFLGNAVESGVVVEAQLLSIDGKSIGKSLLAEVRPGSDKALIVNKFSGIKTWTAETPDRYRMRFNLKKDDQIVHTVTETFGFRTIEVRPSDGLYVNGHKIQIRGVNRHSFRPETGRTLSYKTNLEDVQLIRSMNMNAVRLSHYPSDPEFLDICDSLGLYVMDELLGWQRMYDTEVGKILVKEMVTRDANHPSILWWANGNEGGHNFDLDAEFACWELQNRPVVHPQRNFGGFETMHYRSYGESQEYMRKPEIFMPTEFLHGLYDGGLGAGLHDYWEMMRNHPRCAGGFLWVLADEGVVRTDLDGKIDNMGNYGADGIVGPHHEKEGSYFTIKEIWCPVQLTKPCLSKDFDGKIKVENRYDFVSLNTCRFEWALIRFAGMEDAKAGHEVLSSGKVNGPSVLPHTTGEINLKLPSDWQQAEALQLKVRDASGQELLTWTWPIERTVTPLETKGTLQESKGALPETTSATKQTASAIKAAKPTQSLSLEKTAGACTVSVGDVKLTFSTANGELTGVLKAGKPISFGQGPRFIAARRADRSMDVFYNHDDPVAKSKERIYNDISGESKLKDFQVVETKDTVQIKADYTGDFCSAVWTITSDGQICLDYEYRYDGVVELLGVKFDYPENQMLSKRWLGNGPYRVWQNRLQGPTLDVWQTDYNDPIPAETFLYPEFKGYFSGWRWVDFTTTEGNFKLKNASCGSYLGVYTPRDGRDAQLYTLPASGIAVLKVIPAVRNKVNSTDLNGPSAQAQWVSGLQKGRIRLEF